MEGDGWRGLDPNARKTRLGRAVQAEVVRGGVVESQSGFSAVIRYGRPVNHVLHLLLTLLTCGLWGFAWFVTWAIATRKRKTVTLQVDEFGEILRQEIR